MELTRSSFFCMTVNRGKAVIMITAMVTTITGRITRKIRASPGFIATAMMMAPISMPGARSIMRSPIMIRFCT